MKYATLRNILYYVIAVLLTLLVFSLKYYYPSIAGTKSPFLLFIFVPLTITYMGGWYPGLFSLFLTVILAIYFFIAPYNNFVIGELTSGIHVLAYIIEALIGIKIISSLKEAELILVSGKQRLEEQVEQRTIKIHRASERLQKLNIELQRSNNELEEFAYIASHDLQEPLRKIQAFGNLLQEECKESLVGEADLYLSRILNAVSRMRKLINDLLEYSRVKRSTQFLQQIDLHTILMSVLGDLELYINETNTKVHIDPLPRIEADPLLMQQLFQNLIINAIHYRHPNRNPMIYITAKLVKDTHAVISVKDNGIGFDEQYSDKIFKIFERLHSKNEKSGTGIGLAICRKIVEQHQGTITAHSKKDIGATFIITLPIHFQNHTKENRV